jgi:hypothetical protein
MLLIFGKAAPNQTATWEPSPTTRGSFQILSTCLITLGLCVWTAIHPNIPEQNRPLPRPWWDPRGWVKRHTWRRLGWLTLGVFAPEMVCGLGLWDCRPLTVDRLHLLPGRSAEMPKSSPPRCKDGSIRTHGYRTRRVSTVVLIAIAECMPGPTSIASML